MSEFLELVWRSFPFFPVHFDINRQQAGPSQTPCNSSPCCSHPASIDNSLDRGIFRIFIITALKCLGFPGLPYPHMPANLARVKGKEMAGLGEKNLIKQIL